MTKKSVGIILAAAMLFPARLLAAPAVPAPGESLPAPRGEGNPLTNEMEIEAQSSGGERFKLNSVRVEHEGLRLSDEKLIGIFSHLTGREISAIELGEGISALTRYAREKGYPAATAYVPSQTAADGNLTVAIAPGRLGKIRIENESGLKDHVAMGILAGLHEGEIIKGRILETALRNLRDLSGVEAVGVLSPGDGEGTSDLTVKIAKGKETSLIVYSENYGSRSAGRYRYGLQGEIGNIFGTGGKLNLGTLISNKDQHGYNISLEIPTGHSATRLGMGFSRSDYELGAGLEELGAKGITNTYSVFGRTPILATAQSSLELTYGYDYRAITDEMTKFDFSWKKHSHILNLGLSGAEHHGMTHMTYSLGLHTGTLVPDSEAADELGRLGDTTGRFTKGTIDITAVQVLGKRFDILGKLSGQKAASNLDSSEHIYLGGARGVRAYPQGEASGDEGLLGTLELRCHAPAEGLTFSAYLDAGHVAISKSGGDGNMTLKGWGVAVSYARPGDWFARLDYARRIGGDELMSEDAKAHGRIWFIAGKVF